MIAPKFTIPISTLANMEAIVNDPKMRAALIDDPISCGNRVSMLFMYSPMNPEIVIEPEDFLQCPVLLVHPEKNLWTPLSTSRVFFDRLSREWRSAKGAEN